MSDTVPFTVYTDGLEPYVNSVLSSMEGSSIEDACDIATDCLKTLDGLLASTKGGYERMKTQLDQGGEKGARGLKRSPAMPPKRLMTTKHVQGSVSSIAEMRGRVEAKLEAEPLKTCMVQRKRQVAWNSLQDEMSTYVQAANEEQASAEASTGSSTTVAWDDDEDEEGDWASDMLISHKVSQSARRVRDLWKEAKERGVWLTHGASADPIIDLEEADQSFISGVGRKTIAPTTEEEYALLVDEWKKGQ